MILTKLDVDLFKILVNHNKVTLNQLSEFLSISLVSTRKSIKRLKKFLRENSFGEIYNNKTIYWLKIYKKQFILKKDKIDESKIASSERVYYILWKLILEKEINLSQLAKKFDLNRTSLNLNMTKIKNLLEKYNLGIVSLPWKGISIEGDPETIHLFSIKLLFKFLIEREYNKLSWDLYGHFVNPFIKTSLDNYSYLLKKEFINLEKIKIRIAEDSNISIGTYSYTYIEAVLLYLIIFEKNINKNDLNFLVIEKMSLPLQEKFYNLCNKFSKIEGLAHNKKIKNKIELLSFFILHIDEKFFEFTLDSKIMFIKNSLEKIYNIKFFKKDLIMLNVLLKTFLYKYDFSIKSFNNYYLEEYPLPNKSINDLKNIFGKIKFNILNEDYYLLSLYLYQLICNKYAKCDSKKKIIIIDSSINNWIGKGLKDEISKYIPFMKIKIKTIYKVNNEDFKEYDYILFTDFIDKQHILNKGFKYRKKIYLISYKNYFQITDFLDTLLFRES